MTTKYETIIGLEVHLQLNTNSKLFCGCSTRYGAEPNANTCPVCIGLPGTLPVINEKAVEYALLACRATGCEINQYNKFDRKNYYYPDLPKGYQISQYDLPIGYGGAITIEVDNKRKEIGLTRIHLEEDAGKLIHKGSVSESDNSLVDYNRGGIPLIEIVSEPDLRTPEEAREYLNSLKQIMLYLGISDCNMEEGSLRCDANVSLRPEGQQEFGVKVEVKNMNSFRAVENALSFELERQKKLLDDLEEVVMETRSWDEDKGRTVSMRGKEEAEDYRYFPEPDLMPLEISDSWIKNVDQSLPELPLAKKDRFREEYELPEYDAGVLTGDFELAKLFEEAVAADADPKEVSNWLMGEFLKLIKEENLSPGETQITGEKLASLLGLIEDGTISSKIAKDVFTEMFSTGKDPKKIVADQGLTQISDEDKLLEIINNILDENLEVVDDVKNGKDRAIGFLVGQVMKETKGQANPQLANELIRQEIEKR
ncbi:MAG: Asp-tRNA(Asn)/Glu-tRNA(Gln) amidotransferase subunit GatB [Bacillota bacterium]